MNWKWLRCFICRAASLALLVALAGQSPAPLAWAQESVTVKSPAEQAAPKKDSTDQTQTDQTRNPITYHPSPFR